VKSPFKSRSDGSVGVRLDDRDRDLLESLPAYVLSKLDTDDGVVRRLFPPAYTEDPLRQAEYDSIVRSDLVSHHKSSLSVLEDTAHAKNLSADQAQGWLVALNDLRLVLGTQLDVKEETELPGPDDPTAPLVALYLYLGHLQWELVEALAARL